jgi:tRNA (adenine57-N1/adenine58-N1)-methyltransferase
MVDAEALIGLPNVLRFMTTLGQPVLVFRPTYARLIPNLPRQAQVIYPKDAASIIVWGDIYPGARVIESGVGPGALTMALLRAIGPDGHLTSIERREDHIQMARDSVSRFHGPAPNWRPCSPKPRTPCRRCAPIASSSVTAPRPGPLLDAAARGAASGGVLVCYVPTTVQIDQIGQACATSRASCARDLRDPTALLASRRTRRGRIIVVAHRIHRDGLAAGGRRLNALFLLYPATVLADESL